MLAYRLLQWWKRKFPGGASAEIDERHMIWALEQCSKEEVEDLKGPASSDGYKLAFAKISELAYHYRMLLEQQYLVKATQEILEGLRQNFADVCEKYGINPTDSVKDSFRGQS